ncbi:hypothetical protein [Novosphingobium decolorationis]|uniref:Uncharacterized protein n=1 Tax=Novosphingobium decolorationis TaxID=2698673 RepID=A0ABX8E5G3_9SPHN|nr:hypothetical protein [Novosphingobium decolorationis]MED5546232.1 hypothetical protein [Pseudomonadota bacterium]QVM84173.1 hypothetical protein HT578_11180 [Novosphingobium decolorationis]
MTHGEKFSPFMIFAQGFAWKARRPILHFGPHHCGCLKLFLRAEFQLKWRKCGSFCHAGAVGAQALQK